jgi:hypothetical protein
MDAWDCQTVCLWSQLSNPVTCLLRQHASWLPCEGAVQSRAQPLLLPV